MSLTGLYKFKEGVSKIQELLSLRKGIDLHLQDLEIKIDLSEETKRQLVFSFLAVTTNNWAGFQGKPSVNCAEDGSNGRLEDKFDNFQGERNFSKIDCVINICSAEL